MLLKSFSLFGRELFRVERDREGNFSYNLLENNAFENANNFLKTSLNNPVIQTIIALRCKMLSQVKISHVDSKGNEIINSECLKLLKTPNFFQSQQDFIFQLAWFMSATGTNYTYQKRNAINSKPVSIYNLIPSEIDLNNVHKINKFICTKDEINEYQSKRIKYKLENQIFEFELKDIIPFYDLANGLEKNSFMKSPSRLNGISKTIQNIDENLKSKNINLKMSQKYLATNQGVSNGVTPQLQENDRNAIENVLHKKSMQITNVPIKVQHLVQDFKKLFLDEMYANDMLICLLAFEMNKDVLNCFSNGSSTYDNQNQGVIAWIQNSIQSDIDSILDSFSQTWGLFQRNERLVGTFDHLPIMASVTKSKIETFKLFQESLSLSIKNGLSLQEANNMTLEMKVKLKL